MKPKEWTYIGKHRWNTRCPECGLDSMFYVGLTPANDPVDPIKCLEYAKRYGAGDLTLRQYVGYWFLSPYRQRHHTYNCPRTKLNGYFIVDSDMETSYNNAIKTMAWPGNATLVDSVQPNRLTIKYKDPTDKLEARYDLTVIRYHILKPFFSKGLDGATDVEEEYQDTVELYEKYRLLTSDQKSTQSYRDAYRNCNGLVTFFEYFGG